MKPETTAACEMALSVLARATALIESETRETISQSEPPDLVRFFADVREYGEAIREAVKPFAKVERELSYDKIPTAFDTAGIQNVRVTGYGLVSLVRAWSCSMLDKAKAFEFLRSTGQGGMIIETVAAPTLGAWAGQEVTEHGREPPEDIFKTTMSRHVSLRRSK